MEHIESTQSKCILPNDIWNLAHKIMGQNLPDVEIKQTVLKKLREDGGNYLTYGGSEEGEFAFACFKQSR